jgi:phosphotransacetylase
MQIITNYCDFCGHPMRDDETDIIMIIEKNKTKNLFDNNMDDILKETHEVCHSCKKLVRLIFSLKKDRMEELEKILEKQYVMTPQEFQHVKVISSFYKEMKNKGLDNEKIDNILERIIIKAKEGKEKVIINLNKED